VSEFDPDELDPDEPDPDEPEPDEPEPDEPELDEPDGDELEVDVADGDALDEMVLPLVSALFRKASKVFGELSFALIAKTIPAWQWAPPP